ncbi:hypothetical protein HDU76_000087 [Blyttiomyces sp. JEL0837]|nr:hypothetical protein HDU76_000087 [Blyttiomyces sp. JEL0837]
MITPSSINMSNTSSSTTSPFIRFFSQVMSRFRKGVLRKKKQQPGNGSLTRPRGNGSKLLQQQQQIGIVDVDAAAVAAAAAGLGFSSSLSSSNSAGGGAGSLSTSRTGLDHPDRESATSPMVTSGRLAVGVPRHRPRRGSLGGTGTGGGIGGSNANFGGGAGGTLNSISGTMSSLQQQPTLSREVGTNTAIQDNWSDRVSMVSGGGPGLFLGISGTIASGSMLMGSRRSRRSSNSSVLYGDTRSIATNGSYQHTNRSMSSFGRRRSMESDAESEELDDERSSQYSDTAAEDDKPPEGEVHVNQLQLIQQQPTKQSHGHHHHRYHQDDRPSLRWMKRQQGHRPRASVRSINKGNANMEEERQNNNMEKKAAVMGSPAVAATVAGAVPPRPKSERSRSRSRSRTRVGRSDTRLAGTGGAGSGSAVVNPSRLSSSSFGPVVTNANSNDSGGDWSGSNLGVATSSGVITGRISPSLIPLVSPANSGSNTYLAAGVSPLSASRPPSLKTLEGGRSLLSGGGVSTTPGPRVTFETDVYVSGNNGNAVVPGSNIIASPVSMVAIPIPNPNQNGVTIASSPSMASSISSALSANVGNGPINNTSNNAASLSSSQSFYTFEPRHSGGLVGTFGGGDSPVHQQPPISISGNGDGAINTTGRPASVYSQTQSQRPSSIRSTSTVGTTQTTNTVATVGTAGTTRTRSRHQRDDSTGGGGGGNTTTTALIQTTLSGSNTGLDRSSISGGGGGHGYAASLSSVRGIPPPTIIERAERERDRERGYQRDRAGSRGGVWDIRSVRTALSFGEKSGAETWSMWSVGS